MKLHLVVVVIANALAWMVGVSFAMTSGALPWWLLYLLCGSMYSIVILARDPLAFIGQNNPAWGSLLNYVGVTIGWLPLIAFAGHEGALNVLRTNNDTLAREAEISEMLHDQLRENARDSGRKKDQ